ncbi:LysM peptidoglycan-binding domain-containing protein [Enterovirga sp.]|uniref:LysM peptidoglycan-binding domain-containing protein n=1 Tax=Enterovirga sp. TaxID=2026350 RepID=UPI00261415CC|nr:LysM peptidoglycan-binding domain-containing protein [Enterovirga sp.]
MPSFDVVRVEPSGDSVVAGRAAPGARVDLVVDGKVHASTSADAAGQFALVPPPLPPGPHEIVLDATAPDGTRRRSAQSVTVVIAESRREPPLVTVTAPGRPVEILSRPDDTPAVAAAPAPARTSESPRAAPQPSSPGPTGAAPPAPAAVPASAAPAAPAAPSPARSPVRIASVESEGAGRLLVSATATPGATVRLYLSDTFIAAAAAEADGRVAFSIERGIRPGSYLVRLDEVDPASGGVRSRVEVPFTAPAFAVASAEPEAVPPPRPAAAPPAAPPPGASSSSPAAPLPAPVVSTPVASTPTTAAPSTAAPSASAAPSGVIASAPDVRPDPAAGRPKTVVIPQVNTAVVARGDSLWEISRRTYGDGVRYTVIYGANAQRIRDPNLIYPGQVFVLPAPAGEGAAAR